MKKLLVLVALWTALCVMFAIAQEAEVSLELTEVETLQISIVLKDLVILQLQINNLNARFQTLTNQQDNMQAGLDRMIGRLRTEHEAPADKFTFDQRTLKFVPIPPSPDEPGEEEK